MNINKIFIKDQNKEVEKLKKNNELDKLINLLKYYQIDEANSNKIYDFLIAKSMKFKFKKINFLIISNSTFEVFKKLVERSFVVNKILVKISYRDYNSILTEQKIKGLKNIDVALIYCNNEELKTYTTFQDKLRYQNKDVEITMQYINRIIDKLKDFQISKIFLSNFCEFTNSELGNFTRLYPQNKIKFIHKLNDNVDNIVKKKKIYLLDNNNLSIKFGLNKILEKNKFFLAKIPFSYDYAYYYFSIFSNLVAISLGKTKKVIITDLDNTLWGGVLGDDGPEGIEVGTDTPIGNAYLEYQNFLLNLKSRGLLLAICSKNSFDNVKNVFKKNKNLLLKINDFVSIKANWLNKAKNIAEISNELKLGLDSFVFIDDSPVERELVRNYLPEVSVPELPDDPSYYSEYIKENYFFDLINLSEEDLKRSQSYISNFKRETLKTKFNNIDDYLKSLKMTVKISKFKQVNIDRIVQLFQRSNQFNLTTIRYSYSDIERFIKNNKISFQFSFKDKFSDYGIISLMVCTKNKDKLEIDSWVMSCRVLNRSLENFILNYLIGFCKKNEINAIIGNYKKSEKNLLVSKIYDDLGFKLSKKSSSLKKYTYDIKKINKIKTFVKEIN